MRLSCRLIELPKLVMTPIRVDLPEHARRLYDQMESRNVPEFEDGGPAPRRP